MRAIKLFESTADLTNSRKHIGGLLILQKLAPVHHTTLAATETVWTDKIPTAATDGVYVYINPEYYRGLPTDSQRAFLLAHEVGHIIRQHPQRAVMFKKNGLAGKAFDPKTYNVAGDYLIKDDNLSMGLVKIEAGLYSDAYGRDDLVESVYAELVQGSPDTTPADDQSGDEAGDDQSGDDQSGDDQSGDEGGDQQGDTGGSESSDSSDPVGEGSDSSGTPSQDACGCDDPMSNDHGGNDLHLEPKYAGDEGEQAAAAREDQHQIQLAVDDGVEVAAQQGVSISGDLAQHGFRACAGRDSGVDFRAELTDLLLRVGEQGDATWSRINRRRYANLGVISPARRGALKRMINIIDVSSSVDRDRLNDFLAWEAEMIDQFTPDNGVLVMFVNHKLVSTHEVYSGSDLLDLVVPSGGGTNMSAGIDFIRDEGIESDLTVVFTDGDLVDSGWKNSADNDAEGVSDRVMCSYNQRQADKYGVRVITAG